MQSKDLYLKQKLAEKGKFDYSQEQVNNLKKEFIDNLFIYKDKEKAFEEAYKKVFGGSTDGIFKTFKLVHSWSFICICRLGIYSTDGFQHVSIS